jgi:FMN-dependent NADH-azoreductase
MTTLFVLDTSPAADAASRGLVDRFVAAVSAADPDATVIRHDIGRTPHAHLDDALIDALRRQPDTLDAHQQAARDASDALIAEIESADAIVIGAPMHNFTVSGALRTQIDHLARPGVTFAYDAEKGLVGLLTDKPVYVISTRGGQYGDGDAADPHPADFQTPYLRHILGFMGLHDVRIIAANGLDMGPESRAQGLAAAEAKVDAAVTDLMQVRTRAA